MSGDHIDRGGEEVVGENKVELGWMEGRELCTQMTPVQLRIEGGRGGHDV